MARSDSGDDNTVTDIRPAEALEGKRILLLPVSGAAMDIKTTNVNRLLETYRLRSLSQDKSSNQQGAGPA